MTHVLAQRKYRLAARLGAEMLSGYGLWIAIAFAVLAAGSAVLRAATGGDEEFSLYVFMVLPLFMTAFGWIYLDRAYPAAIARGMTRRELLTAYALFGIGLVLIVAAFTQLALLTLRLVLGGQWGDQYDFYGLALGESIVRPALYFACGAAAAAAMLRSASRIVGAVVSAFALAAVIYRWLGYYAVMKLLGMENASENGVIFEYPNADLDRLLPYLDAVFALVLALFAWVLLARAPMRPKRG